MLRASAADTQAVGLVEVVHADLIPGGWQHWLKWLEVCQTYEYPSDAQYIAMLRADAERNLGLRA
jgi:hypothetical protein